jgi:hypothetical protein
MRWLTGISSFIFILAALSYYPRRRIYNKRRGPLRYWMLAHAYLGVMGCLLIILHAGNIFGGFLTGSLMIAFGAVILTGLFGLGCYLIIPRILTKIEGTPLLVEDLEARGAELGSELSHILEHATAPVSKSIREKVLPRYRTLAHSFRQCRQRESLDQSIEDAKKDFAYAANNLESDTDRRALMRPSARR